MIPQPRMSGQPPFRWVGSVVLDLKDVRRMVAELPETSPLRGELKDAAQAAAQLAERLNQVEKEGVAA